MSAEPTSISSTGRQLLLLAPPTARVPATFHFAKVAPGRHEALLADMQRLRGGVYLRDGAIVAQELTADGRHRLAVDDASWHMLTLDSSGQVVACMRYLEHQHPATFDKLGIRHAALAQSDQWGRKLRQAVDDEIARAASREVACVEIGGWALAEHVRCSTEALRLALGAYALSGFLGGGLGISTVTARNGSASILRRIGGRSLETGGTALPAYYDPQYRCEMEMLRFDSDWLNPKFAGWVRMLQAELATAPVICRDERTVSENWARPLSEVRPLAPVGALLSEHALAN